MGTCEICGKTDINLLRASIEGTEMNVCNACAKYGKLVYVPPSASQMKRKKEVVEAVEIEFRIVNDFSNIIRRSREKLGLTQEEFAKKLNQKLSLMRALENKEQIPSIKLAENLEKQLDVVLIEEAPSERINIERGNSKEVTLGDMIKIKTRKK